MSFAVAERKKCALPAESKIKPPPSDCAKDGDGKSRRPQNAPEALSDITAAAFCLTAKSDVFGQLINLTDLT